MSKSRKDKKGRTLRKGEVVRSATGGYQYSYIDKTGKRRYIYDTSLVGLREKEAELLRDQMDQIDSRLAMSQSLNDLFYKYMATRKDLSARTYAGYMYQYNAYVRKTIGKRKIRDIKYSDILLFYKDLLEKYNFSFGTIEHLQRELHPAFEMAVRDSIIRTNPTSKILGQLKKQVEIRKCVRRALTPEEQNAFLQFVDGHPVYEHWKPIFVFLMGTGVRAGEMSGLRWKDIDFEKRIITIDHAVVYFAGKMNKSENKLYISAPKTKAGIRKIPMVKEVVEALQEVKEYQIYNDIVCNVEIDGYTDFVFLNRFGNVFIEYNLDRALTRIIDAYNKEIVASKKKDAVILPHFTCHSLRHTFCSRFCENETNIKVIQSIMGHVDIQTTMNIYAEVSDAKKKESMDSISDKLMLF